MKKGKVVSVRFSDSEYKVLQGMAGKTPVATFIRQSLFECHSDSHDNVITPVTVTQKEPVTVTYCMDKPKLDKRLKDFNSDKKKTDWIPPEKNNPPVDKDLPDMTLPANQNSIEALKVMAAKDRMRGR